MQNKTNSNSSNIDINFTEIVSGTVGRALMATPFDNFAKRSQKYQGPIGAKQIPLLFFQKGTSKFNKLLNLYRGTGVGFIYKGIQTYTFDISFSTQKSLQDKFGDNTYTKILNGVGVSTISTLLLQPISTLRTRVQVNIGGFEHSNQFSVLLSSIGQGKFFDGTSPSLLRNIIFLTTTSLLIDSYRQAIQRYNVISGGKGDLSEKQENLARTLCGCTAIFPAVLFDNVKTRRQVSGKLPDEHNILTTVFREIKTKGFKTSLRAGIPYSIAEALGLFGFYTSTTIAKNMQKKLSQEEIDVKSVPFKS